MKVKLAELIEDPELYPRHAVDGVHVAGLVRALEAGATLPPMVVDKKSMRIVDGFHRSHAYRRFLGDDGVVEITFKEYKNEADIVADAISMNASHGRRLDGMDQVRAVILAERVGLSAKTIARVLVITEARVEELRVRVATVAASSEDAVPGTHTVALKQSIIHMQGKRLTIEQAEAHRSLPGTSMRLLVDQLSKAIRTDLLDREDESLMAVLDELRKLISEYLRSRAA